MKTKKFKIGTRVYNLDTKKHATIIDSGRFAGETTLYLLGGRNVRLHFAFGEALVQARSFSSERMSELEADAIKRQLKRLNANSQVWKCVPNVSGAK